jgi:hypothetical protein
MVRSVTAEICATGLLKSGGSGFMAHISHNVLREAYDFEERVIDLSTI